MKIKGVYLLGTTSSSTGTIVAWPSLLFNSSMFSACDVMINLTPFTGTLGSAVNFSFQENFSDAGYVETAKSGSLAAAGVYWLIHSTAGAVGTTPSNISMYSPVLGKGREKRFQTTFTTAPGTITANVYVIPYDE